MGITVIVCTFNWVGVCFYFNKLYLQCNKLMKCVTLFIFLTTVYYFLVWKILKCFNVIIILVYAFFFQYIKKASRYEFQLLNIFIFTWGKALVIGTDLSWQRIFIKFYFLSDNWLQSRISMTVFQALQQLKKPLKSYFKTKQSEPSWRFKVPGVSC